MIAVKPLKKFQETSSISPTAEEKNINFIRKFYFYIGLLPNFDETFNNPTFFYKFIRPAIICTFILTATIVKVTFESAQKDRDTGRFYLTLITSVANLSLIIISIIKLGTWHATTFARFFQTVQEIDRSFQSLNQSTPTIKCYWILLVIIGTFIGVSFIGANAFKRIGTTLILLGGIDHMAMMYVALINVLIMELLCMIYLRFRSLNQVLERMSIPTQEPEMRSSCYPMSHMVNAVMTMHNKLCNMCEMFQEIFGLPMLIYYFQVMMITLSTLKLLMAKEFSGSFMATTLYSTLVVICGVGTIMAVCCDLVTAEARKTISIICDFVNTHQNADSLILEKMEYFLQQAREKAPRFTAASFFVIDNSMIFMFINLTATYIIVMIQFRE